MKPRLSRVIIGLLTASAAASCGDRGSLLTGPSLPGAPATTTSAGPSEVVGLLKRTERIGGPLTASGVIGPKGGELRIQKAGIRVDFPRGAVTTPTLITVTAVPGRTVAYRFEPHGLVFAKPVSVTQSLRKTAAWRNPAMAASLQGSYFERLIVDPSESYARGHERRAGKLKELGRSLEFTIEHFSGYMVSTGKASIEIDLSIEIQIR